MPADETSLLPEPPPPRPARRDAAIAAAMRRFDGIEEPKEAASRPATRGGFGSRPQLGALVTASLIAVIGLPAALIAIRNNQPPSPPPAGPAASEVAADSSAVVSPDATADVGTLPPASPADSTAPAKPGEVQPMALSPEPASRAEAPSVMQAEPDANYAPAPVVAAAPPPPPPPPAPPPPSPAADAADQLAAEVATEDQIVVTGSRIQRPELDSASRSGRREGGASPLRVIQDEAVAAKSSAGSAHRRFVTQLQAAVRSGSRGAVVGLVGLPLRVNFSTGAKTYRTGEAILADYDRIFTARVRNAILSQRPDALFMRDRGAMIGSGQVWFDHRCPNRSCTPPGPIRITAINP